MLNIPHMFKKCQLKKHETLCPIKIRRITREILEPVVITKNLVLRVSQYLKNIRGVRFKQERGF
jgi:hypothetical protein